MVQVNPTKQILRFRMKKTGSLQYISHLDLVRTMHKVIVRAKLPLWYTEGFNPKPKMVFAAPLSIGTESVCEFMDVRLNDYIAPEEAMKRLNANLTDEMQVLECYYAESKFTELKWLAYTITVNSENVSPALVSACNDALNAQTIEVAKKNSDKTFDIKQLIKSAEVRLDGKSMIISAILSADPSTFLNPEYVIKALRDKCGILSSENLLSESYSIMREESYYDDMSIFR